MSRPMRFAAHLLAGLFLAGTLALGWAWHRDRSRSWEEPRWTPEAFVPLRAGQRAVRGGQDTWMVTVNLRCPRCIATLRRIAAARSGVTHTVQLAALIVDTSARPGPEAVRRLPPMPVWWDRDGVWRRRWGHRLYGEMIRFDAAGRHLGTLAAEDALDSLETHHEMTTPPHTGRGEREHEKQMACPRDVRPADGDQRAAADGREGG